MSVLKREKVKYFTKNIYDKDKRKENWIIENGTYGKLLNTWTEEPIDFRENKNVFDEIINKNI
jgi:hypothetical protein